MNAETLLWDENGLIPAVVQDAETSSILMLAYMDRTALVATMDTGQIHFWSRSRQELWRKGATSGNTLTLVTITADCDRDALLVSALPAGPTCHTGSYSCFEVENNKGIAALWRTISLRAQERPEDSYTAHLLSLGTDEVARKVTEEATELVLAAKNHEFGGDRSRVVEEAADLVYHLLVLLKERGVELSDIENELDGRSAVVGE